MREHRSITAIAATALVATLVGCGAPGAGDPDELPEDDDGAGTDG